MNSTVTYTIFGPADPVQLPIISSIPQTLLIAGIYMYFVLKLGRQFMKYRKPYNVRKAMLIYNFLQVIINAILCGYGIYYLFIARVYDWRCMSKLPLDDPRKNTERYLTYAYFLNKIMDLLDTVFFVLRKSYKQITVLHVYHHVLMVVGMSIVCNFYGPGGQYCLMGGLNTFVHAVMYSYYFVTALYPNMKSSLWWKEYITKLQLLQFIILFFQAALVVVFNPSCAIPFAIQLLQLIVATSMIVMFGNFYYHAYMKDKPIKSKEQ